MLITRPRTSPRGSCVSICRTALRQPRNVPRSPTSKMTSQSASLVSSRPFECGPATMALLTMTSRRPPPSSSAASIRRSMSPARVTSAATKRATPPASAMRRSVGAPPTCSGSLCTSPTTTRAPSAANATHIARPSPEAPPVTTIVRSASLAMPQTVEPGRGRQRRPPTGVAGICRSRADARREPMSQLDDDALLASEVALHSALASIPAVSVVVVDYEVRIRALHGSALQRHGYVHAQMLGKRVADALPAPVSERLSPLFVQALAGRITTIHQRSEDGTAFYESTFSPVRGRGRIVAATMTSRDITAQKLAEEKLSEANARLEAVL